jgi:hypothetical protein
MLSASRAQRAGNRGMRAMIKEFSVELSAEDGKAIGAIADRRALHPDVEPGRKTFAFDEHALIAVSNGDFERFLWSAFDRVEERDGIITLAKGTSLVFYLPVSKLRDPEIRRSIWDFVSGRVGLHG